MGAEWDPAEASGPEKGMGLLYTKQASVQLPVVVGAQRHQVLNRVYLYDQSGILKTGNRLPVAYVNVDSIATNLAGESLARPHVSLSGETLNRASGGLPILPVREKVSLGSLGGRRLPAKAGNGPAVGAVPAPALSADDLGPTGETRLWPFLALSFQRFIPMPASTTSVAERLLPDVTGPFPSFDFDCGFALEARLGRKVIPLDRLANLLDGPNFSTDALWCSQHRLQLYPRKSWGSRCDFR